MSQKRFIGRLGTYAGIVMTALAALQAVTAQATVIHDYNFALTGTTADSVGGSTYDGTLVKLTEGSSSKVEAGTGLVLDGNGYVNLPTGTNSILPADATSITIDAWFQASVSNSDWARLFDFGSSNSGQGKKYVFFTPKNSISGVGRVAIATASNSSEAWIDCSNSLADGASHHIAVQLNQVGTGIQMSLALDGNSPLTRTLNNATIAEIVNDTASGNILGNYIGKSNWAADPNFIGTISRITISTTIPEPSTTAIIVSGMTGLLAYAWRKRK